MSFESREGSNIVSVKQKSPLAIRLGMDALVHLSKPIRNTNVEGYENLEDISSIAPVVVATSHTSEFDIPLSVKALSGHLDIAISNQSTHHSIRSEPGMFLSLSLVGKDNFIPISYEWKDGQKVPNSFDPTNAGPMIRAIENNKSVLVAAHNPFIHAADGEVRKPKPGYFAAYLSLLTDTPVLPVGVDLHPTSEVGRFDSVVRIGSPFNLAPMSGVSDIKELIEKRQDNGRLTAIESERLSYLFSELKKRGGEVFARTVSLQRVSDFPLPEPEQQPRSLMEIGSTVIGKLC